MPGSRSSWIGARVVERLLERAQLGVDGLQRRELAADELLVGPVEAVLVEDEAAEVAEAELAHAAQVAQAAAQPAAVAEAGRRCSGGVDTRDGRRRTVGPDRATPATPTSAMRAEQVLHT